MTPHVGRGYLSNRGLGDFPMLEEVLDQMFISQLGTDVVDMLGCEMAGFDQELDQVVFV
jgi:hypothetical protein